MNSTHLLVAEVPGHLGGLRFDQVLAELFPNYSRSRLQTWIKTGKATLDGRVVSQRERVLGGERVEVEALPEPVDACTPQAIPLRVVFEDDSLLVIDKPAGLVVHPAAGHRDGTLRNALLHHAPELETVPRSGLVHRLDKDTTGLLVVARTLEAHKHLVDQLQAREIHREYLALVHGRMTAGGTVDLPIGRHPTDRKRFAVRDDGRDAVTHYRVEERFKHHTLVRVQLETGRTHQIRVHLSHLRFPLVGDPVYGGRSRFPAKAGEALIALLKAFKRQALHAQRLAFAHPEHGEWVEFESPVPDDLNALILGLRAA